MRTAVRTQLHAALATLRANGLAVPDAVEIALDTPKRAEHGDLATNLPLALAKPLGRKPREIAEALKSALDATAGDAASVITSVEIAGPGFLNLRVRDAAFHRVIGDVFAMGERYGNLPARNGGRTLVEFVSANPTGPLHIAHARGAVVGDALVRVMRAAGYDVATEYYINDAGQKVINLAWTIRQIVHGQPLFKEAYRGEYVKELAEQFADDARATSSALGPMPPVAPGEEDEYGPPPVSDPADRALAAKSVSVMMAAIRRTLDRLGVTFDGFFSELAFVENGAVPKLIETWLANGLAEERDGAVFFKASGAGEDDKDRVLRKSSGDYTYFATDVAYHADKLARSHAHLIDVWGADHHGYVARVRDALEALGLPKQSFEVLLMQMVALVKDGKPYRMSKSSGNIIAIDDVLAEIDEAAGHDGAGRDALRYFLLQRSSDSPMELDVGLAKTQSVENPVFYAQYTHARMCALLERARTAPEFEEARARGLLGVPESYDEKLAGRLALSEEKDLLALCDRLPLVVREAAESRAPHRVLFYAQELAQGFASYYTRLQKVHADAILPQKTQREREGWSDEWDWDKTRARLMWLNAVRQVYANALSLLGVAAPTRMAKLSIGADAQDTANEG